MSSSNSNISSEEDNLLLSLVAMFGEKISSEKILEVIKRNQCDIEKSIDELLNMPEPSVLSEDDFEILPPPIDESAEEPQISSEIPSFVTQEPVEVEEPKNLEEQLVAPFDAPSVIESPIVIIENEPNSSVREEELLNRIKELEEANIRLENEKKNGMKFVLGLLEESKKEASQREETIHRLEGEVADLHRVLRENKKHHSKVEKLFVLSKDALLDGFQGFGQATEKSWAEVQFEANKILNSTNDFFSEHDLNFIKKIKDLATSFRKALDSKAKRPIQMDQEDEQLTESNEKNAQVEKTDDDSQDLTDQEKEEFEQARLASLQTFAAEQVQN